MIKLTNKTCEKFYENSQGYDENMIKEWSSKFNIYDLDINKGELIWIDSSKKVIYSDYCNYLVFLLQMSECIYNFIFYDKDKTFEKNIIYKFTIDYMNCLYAYNYIEKKLIYFWNECFLSEAFIQKHNLLININNPLSQSHFILDFVLNLHLTIKARALEQCSPEEYTKLSFDNAKAYASFETKELLNEFIPFYEEHIKDLPDRSIYWQLPQIQEYKRKFEALKQYAKEKGWT